MEFIDNFGIQPTLLLAQIVNFLIILFLLRKFFFGPIVKMLESRRAKIEESLKNADLIEERLQKTKEDSAKIIDNARKQAQSLLVDTRQKVDQMLNQASIEARKTMDDTLIAAQAQIQAEKEKVKTEVQEEAMIIISSVIKKVLGRTMSTKEKEQMTKAAVAEMTKEL